MADRSVASLGTSVSDAAVWQHARDWELVAVTKDADLADRALLSPAAPPWVVHLRVCNVRRAEYHTLLANVWPAVEALLPANKLICAYRDRGQAVADRGLSGETPRTRSDGRSVTTVLQRSGVER